MQTASGTLNFEDVEKGKALSAANQNKLHDAVRDLQKGRPTISGAAIELHRIEPANVATARPEINSGAIGTAVIAKGTTTIHRMETDNLSSVTSVATIKQMNADAKRKLSNIGQKFFSRDEVFTMVTIAGSGIPTKMAGAEKIIGLTSGAIAVATKTGTGTSTVLTPAFATVSVFDWSADGLTLVYSGYTVRVANMSTSGTVAGGAFIQAFILGKNYVIDWELCLS